MNRKQMKLEPEQGEKPRELVDERIIADKSQISNLKSQISNLKS
jgi:hypothetical protein